MHLSGTNMSTRVSAPRYTPSKVRSPPLRNGVPIKKTIILTIIGVRRQEEHFCSGILDWFPRKRNLVT